MQWWADWLDEKVELSTLTTIEEHKALQSSAKLCVHQFCLMLNCYKQLVKRILANTYFIH